MSRKDTPVIIEAAINGMTSKEKNPNAPRAPEEITAEALLCLELGATIIQNTLEATKLIGSPLRTEASSRPV